MFTDGLQDWIGLSETDLFGGRHKPEGLKGWCRVAALVQCDNGAPAARVFGQASKHGQSIPKPLVIVDSTGVVRGVARPSAPVSPLINRTFYLRKLPPHIPPPVYVPNNASALWGEFALRPGGYFVANIFDTGPCFVPTSHA